MSWRPLLFIAALLAGGGTVAAAPATVRLELAGLEKPGTIVVDRWGIPHIFATSEHDAYFLQGYNAARDRLWQIDLWRKRGLGLLSASFGPAYVEQDRAARLFLYRGDMTAEWAAYAPRTQAMTDAFVAGINAYVAATRTGAAPLPVEFGLSGSKPDLWRAEDVVRIRSHALVGNLTSEVARARVTCAGGLAADSLRKKLEPPHVTTVPAGLDPCDIGPDVLKTYELATRPVTFDKGSTVATADAVESGDPKEGSNNWVIAPSRTATGRPILANDPHRQLGAPSLRYIVELNAPGLSLIGAGEPALPGVSFGHNDKVAWGLTIFGDDQEDLYVYTFDPAHPHAYRSGAGWVPMTKVTETISIKGEAPRSADLWFTSEGPVIAEDAARGRAFAVRTVWSEPGAAGYLPSTWLFHARSWSDFLTARDHWGAPPLNLVYADTAGHIGWAAAAKTPIRANWDGLLPVPGDGRYEWHGFLKGADLPSSLDPAKGWFGTANEMNLPTGYPNESRHVSFEWGDRSRIDRIDEVLAANPRSTVADSMALQTDSHSAMSRRLTGLMSRLVSPFPDVQGAIELFRSWDHNETTDSVAASIYEVWTSKYLGRALVPYELRALIGSGSLDAVLTELEQPDPTLSQIEKDAVLTGTLARAVDDLRRRLGPDEANWTWGRLHHAVFTPAVAAFADPVLRARMTVGPLPLPGGPSTPKAATYESKDFNTVSGASVRMVLDVGDWDRSMIVNTPGESGDPDSPHYRDLFPLWAAGKYVPLLFSRTAVDAAAETVIEATPRP